MGDLMPKRCLAVVVLGVLGLSSSAHAELSSSVNPVAIGEVAVGASSVVQATAVSSLADTLDHFHLGPGCGGVSVAPTSGTLPRLISSVSPMSFDVTFEPAARGAVACTVAFHAASHASLGDDFTITAHGIAPEIAVPATVSFPDRRVANAALLTAFEDVVVRNVGDTDLEITALAITGDFAIVSPPALPATIAPSATLTLHVVFDPSAPGPRTGQLDVTSDDPVTPIATTTLEGRGTTAVIAVTDVAFGIVPLGQTSSQAIEVTNTATQDPGPLRIASATITGGDGWFSFGANGSGCLGLASCTFGTGIVAPQAITVRCRPPANASGTRNATVTFASDTDPGGDEVAGLTCTAGRADASVDPTSLAFGSVAVGATAQRTVTVSNTGNLDLVFTATTQGPRAGEYALGGCATNCTVPPGDNRQLTLTFEPTQPGAADVTLELASNDPDDATLAIPVTATAVAPAISAPATLQFNNVEVETTVARTLTITNTGTAPLQISSATLTQNDGSYAVTAGNAGAQTVAPGGSTSWTLTCTPATPGAHPGRFTITSDAFGAATTNTNLACNGTEGVLVVIPTSIDFGGVPEGSGPIVRQYTLRNTGNLPVANLAAVVNPDDVGYDLDPATPLPAQILPGTANQVTLAVRFTPQSADDGGPATVTFSGTWGTANRPLRVPPVLALDGDGLASGFDVTPAVLAFGEVRFDATATRTFCIHNTSEAALAIQQITITPEPGTATGEFVRTDIIRRTCGTPGGTAQTLPASLAPGGQLEVTVVADPADRTGAMAATLAVISDLPVNPARTITLAATATSAALALQPGSTLDFGERDVQGPSTSLDIIITNTGDAPLELTGFARDDAGANSHFTLTLPPDTILAPAASLTIPVTYAPTVATAPAEQIVLAHQVGGVLGGPSSQAIVIRGIGIDRTIQLVADPEFPPTFRNPGVAGAPVRPVTVRNTGRAVLRVSAVMLAEADPQVWTIVNPQPIDIPGEASHDFLVRFAPAEVGLASAVLVVSSDDAASPMAQVTFTGTGIDRRVGFGAPLVDIGYTAANIPLTIADVIEVASIEDTGFTISRIEIGEPDAACLGAAIGAPGVFAIPDATTGIELPSRGTRRFGLTFSPTEQGVFVASASLFVDPDPLPQARVCLRGTALFVDARGGGGCQAGGEVGWGALAVVVIGVLGWRRRRGLAGAVAASVLVVLVPAPPARADNIVLSVFDPTPATTATQFHLQSPEVGKHGDWVLAAIVSHAMNPLVLDAFMDGRLLEDHAVVERSTMFELGFAYAFLDRFEVGARSPFYAQSGEPFGDPQQTFTATPASGTAAGDLTMHGKARLWRGRELSLASAVQVTIPTATERQFTGTDRPSARVLALAGIVPDAMQRRVSLAANLGGVLRSTSRFANLEQGSGVTWGVGTSVRASERVWVAAEMFGDLMPSGRGQVAGGATTLSPAEWLVGFRWLPDRRVNLGFAIGRGLTSSAGAPDLRGVFALSLVPNAPEPRSLGARLPREGDGDRDGDGIIDRLDRCPGEPEDIDLYEDSDGCPDPDNDGDGIPDERDRCPLDPEDKDGFEDDDGCPDKDNDGDGIPDALDRCPNEPEDKDGFQDVDGCPDPDNDGDGIPDALDRCPNEPETINGNKDEDGCPDPGDPAIVVSSDRLEMLDPVQFTTGAKLAPASFNILGQVAATLRAHPEIVRLRITSHVHPSGNPQRDQELSDKRAIAIRDWLVEWGIAESRVEARGFGSTKPLAPANQRGAAAFNDRIELIILERR
jgi:outer membrane protein OmpA-like peptidoglycan-associated protein